MEYVMWQNCKVGTTFFKKLFLCLTNFWNSNLKPENLQQKIVINASVRSVKVMNIRCKRYECLNNKSYECLSCKTHEYSFGTTSSGIKYYWTTADTGTRI